VHLHWVQYKQVRLSVLGSKKLKILRHKDVVFNEKKMYKDLLTERGTSEKNPRVASRSTPGQQDATELEFVELDEVPMKKVRSILKGNEEFRVEPLTPQSELRRSTWTTRAPARYSPTLHYLLLTNSGEPECEEALQVEEKAKWELAMNDEMESLMKN